MSKRWLAVAVVLVACRSKGEPPDVYDGERLRKMFLDSYKTPQSVAEQDVSWPVPTPAVAPEPPPAPPAPPQPAPSECIDSGEIASFDAGTVLRACFDRNGDGTADRCVRWSPDGKPLDYDPAVDDVHTVEAVEQAPEPVAFHSDTKHNDDSRIDVSSGIEICPYDRTCMKLMPRVDDEHATGEVLTDAEYHRAAIAVLQHDSKRGYIELWDLDRGRAYAKLPFRGLMRDATYTFSVRLGRGALVALAENQTDNTISGAIYGLDGGFRGMLAGGARKLALEDAIETSGMFLVLEEQPDGKPYVLHAVDLAAGAAPGRFAIPRADDTAPQVQLHWLAPGVVAATQWGKQLRLDVIDVRARSMRTLRAPAC